MLRRGIAQFALVSAMAAAPVHVLAETGVTEDTITIGAFGPLTGPVSLYGYPVINGAVAVFEEMNDNGGVHGRKIRMVYEDDGCDAAKARAAVKKLVFSANVFAIHGGSCSGAIAAARDVIADAEAPYMVLTAVLDSITDPVVKNIFTTTQPASADGRTMAAFAASIPGIKKIAIVKNTDDWADAHLSTIYPTLAEAGIEVAADVVLERNASDATTQVLKAKEAGVDAILLVTYPNESAVFLREAKKYDLAVPFIGASSQMDMLAVAERTGDPAAVKDYYVSAYLTEPVDGEAVAEYAAIYQKHFPQDKLQTLSFYGMSGAFAIIEALEKAGPDLTREGFIAALESIDGGNAGPAFCKVKFSAEDHQGCKEGHVWAIRDGKVISVGTSWPN